MKKNFVTGFIAGGIICATVTGFAVEYAVTANPFPVKVNGQTVQVEGYNINDSSYFKLRDIADAVGGFEVGFEDNAIIVNTPSQPTATPVPTPTAKDNLAPLPEVEIEIIDGAEYVRKSNIEKMLDVLGLGQYKFSATYFYNDLLDDGSTILSNIPHHPTNNELIPIDYYNSTIIPTIHTLQ